MGRACAPGPLLTLRMERHVLLLLTEIKKYTPSSKSITQRSKHSDPQHLPSRNTPCSSPGRNRFTPCKTSVSLQLSTGFPLRLNTTPNNTGKDHTHPSGSPHSKHEITIFIPQRNKAKTHQGMTTCIHSNRKGKQHKQICAHLLTKANL